MNTIISGSVIGSGYLLNNEKNNRTTHDIENLFKQPNNQYTYSSDIHREAKTFEHNLSEKNFENARNAVVSNVVPPEFNHSIVNKTNSIENIEKSELTGDSIDFKHNNMIPFFGPKVRQNIEPNSSKETLANHTGIEHFYSSKKETQPSFNPTYDSNLNYGTQNQNEDIQNRVATSNYRRNELPFDKIQVGPGLNNGYVAKPSGGFHQDTRPYIMPKSIDELRPKSNPKITYSGRMIPGKEINDKSGKIGKVEKHTPQQVFKQGPEKYLTTTGAYLKEKKRPCIIAKDTNRKISKQILGTAGPSLVKNPTSRSLYKKSNKQIFKTSGPRNLHDPDGWQNKSFGDYGKKSMNLPAQERDITGARSHISNFISIVKQVMAPVLDNIRTTKKENFIGNIRQSGNIGASNVDKTVVWDPNDVPRTTIKETNIHDNRTGNIAYDQKGVAWDPNDTTRTTIKETSIHDNRTGNIQNDQKGVAWDPNDTTRTTIKETSIHDNRTGNIQNDQKGVAWDPNDTTRTTIKETNIHDNRTGNINNDHKGVAWDPNDTTRTTIKETNIHDTRTGNMNSDHKGVAWDPNDTTRTTIKETSIHDTRTGNMLLQQKGTVLDTKEMKFKTTIRETVEPAETTLNLSTHIKNVVYDPNDVAKTTIKETNIHDSRYGNLKGPVKLKVYDPNDIAKTTIKETNIHDNRTGNIDSIKQEGGAYLTNDVQAPETHRQFTSEEYSGIMDNEKIGLGYITNETEAPDTHRQFTSDIEYEGTAESMYKKPKNYSTAYRARTNQVREGTLKGRSPTKVSTKIYNGKDKLNVEVKKIPTKKIRPVVVDKIYSDYENPSKCTVTKQKKNNSNCIMGERIDPALLEPFKNNPFTKPLNSIY